ncbi:MFS transporter [Xylanimonas ulmi]|uniref:Putative MFS family arabinose efflux permease n=1 Tax=Xylanimonas ulmi TaxID=228973 RepID=A0A4Q7M3Q7_9MICO|nr:MFS transporter [Xylanibacterium ulmi]RZS62575.1 putative MFS family arabinose efflux permease [Xylanibacterium ulmi]
MTTNALTTDALTTDALTTDALGAATRPGSPPGRLARTAVLASAGLTIMAPALIAPSLPAMAGHFDDQTAVRLALTITSLAIAVGAPLAGVLADRIGRRPVLLGGLAVYAVAGSAGLVVPNLGTLLATRAVLGLGVAAVTTAVGALLTDWFTGRRRATYLGYQQAAASLGGVVLLPLAGLLADVGWRAPFWLYAVAAPIAALALVAVPRTRSVPAARPSGGTTSSGTPSPRLAGRVVGLYLLALAATAVFYMAPTQLPFLLGEMGAGPGVVGVAIAGSTLTSLAGSLAFPAVRRRLSPTAITLAALALLGAGWTLIGQAGGLGLVVIGLLVGGAGVGLTVPNLNLRLGDLAPDGRRGRILAGLVTGIFLGQFLSPLAAGPLVTSAGPEGAFVAAGLLTLVGAALAASLLLPRRGR